MATTMATINFSLPPTMKQYIEEQVTVGQYGTASEFLRELVRERQKQAAQAKLEQLLLEGINSGAQITVTPQWWEDFQARMEQTYPYREKPANRSDQPGPE